MVGVAATYAAAEERSAIAKECQEKVDVEEGLTRSNAKTLALDVGSVVVEGDSSNGGPTRGEQVRRGSRWLIGLRKHWIFEWSGELRGRGENAKKKDGGGGGPAVEVSGSRRVVVTCRRVVQGR